MSDIEIIQDFIYEMRTFGLTKDTLEVVNALENILTEREQDKKRIKELEEENTQLEATKDDAIRRYNSESIPVQKVKDKIEEIENAKRETTRENWHYIYTIQLKILEELLEENNK